MSTQEQISIKDLTNDALLRETKSYVQRERAMTIAVLHRLREIQARKLYLGRGYSSLFDFVTRELGYDNASAMRRIDAMRLLSDLPEVEEKIQKGSLTLTSVAQAQAFFKKETFGIAQKKEIVSRLEGQSTRQVQKTLLGFSQTPACHFEEKVRPVTPELSEVRFYANDELLDKIEKLKGLLAHSHPKMSTCDLIDYLAQLGLERLDPSLRKGRAKKTVTASKPSACPTAKAAPLEGADFEPTLRPPSQTMSRVWKRDGGRCVWRDPMTGKICGSGFRIQVDHIFPRALGGDHSFENLRCLCASHNRFEAERWFGPRVLRAK